MPEIDLILFDIGGVLGTNGWGREERARAVRRFRLPRGDFEARHQDAMGVWEEGGMTMEEYLDITVFYEPRSFTRQEFSAFMFEQSLPNVETIELARMLARSGRYRLMTFNNESAELNLYRIEKFGLREIFSAFFTSCYMGVRKPIPAVYRRVLDITQAEPSRTVFLDDRVQNLTPARALGVHVIHFTTLEDVERRLAELRIAVRD